MCSHALSDIHTQAYKSSAAILYKSLASHLQLHVFVNLTLSGTVHVHVGIFVCVILSFQWFCQGKESTMKWEPEELSHQDVAALYSCDADGWTMVDKVPGQS